MRFALKSLSLLVVAAVLASCSSSSSPATYTVGGTVSGLAGSGLVLQNGGGNNLSVSTSGAFTFSAPMASGAAYAVTVLTQPASPAQTCTVTSGSGTVGSANVTNVSVTCVIGASTVGGTVTGLNGTGLVLQDNGGDNLSVSASGAFTFATPVASGAAYAVTVLTQPTSPSQTCTVANGAGTMGAANVTSVAVTCVTNSYTVGGTVAGLTGTGLVLRNNGGNNLTVSASGAFTFSAPVASGGAYAVTVLTQPTSPSQTCSVTNGTGTVASANVTTVAVTCVTNNFTVGGTVIGLQGAGLVLATAGQANLSVASGATTFAFASAVPSGTAYAVTVVTQPTGPVQTCTVGAGTGTVGAANVTTVVVNCSTSQFLIGGTVSGLAGTGLVLSTAGQADLTVLSSATSFAFGSAVPSGSTYAVTVKTQPTTPSQTCAVTNGSGTVGSGNVTNIAVTCVTNTYTVGVTVTGLAGTGMVLQNNTRDNLPITGNTAFTFATRVLSGAAYSVTVLTPPSSPSQTCTPASGSGTVGSANVVIAVTCVTNTYTVGVTVTGLAGTGMVVQNNGADNLPITGNTAFTFATRVASGGAYAVTVLTPPSSPSQTCTPASGSGTVGNANVVITVTCATNTYTVGGTVSGLAGTGLVLRNNGTDDLAISANGAFTFTTPVLNGATYLVTIQTSPSAPAQTCALSNANGTISGANVVNVGVTCPAPANVIQEWATPTAWGGDAAGVWPDTSPNMIQHLIFNASGPVETKLAGGTWTAAPSAPAITSTTGIARPVIPRYGAGPFGSTGAPLHYSYSVDTPAVSLGRDMLVCALVKPDWDPLNFDGTERILMSKGKQAESGWVLMQMHGAFCFHYQIAAGSADADWRMTDTATDYDPYPPAVPNTGPLNTSFVVVCAGRDDTRGRIVIAANSYEPSVGLMAVPPTAGYTSTRPVSVGGYDDGDVNHVFKGKIYETAVWAEAATPENIQAKMALVLGLTLPGGGVANYVHNREAPFTGVDGLYHTAWRHGPRIYPGKGFLFGLQGTNKVAHPQALGEWTPTGGPTVTDNALLPPNDSAILSASHLVLPAGAGIKLPLASFSFAGKVEGQIWIRPASTGTLRVRADVASVPGPGLTSIGSQDIPLGTAGTWSRVAITSIVSPAPSAAATVYLENPGVAPIDLYAWGVALMQIGRGADIGFDPGFTMYDTLKNSDDREAVILPPVTDTTATTGFCLSAQAAPFEGMAWTAPFAMKRVAISWTGVAVPLASAPLAQLYVDSGNVCLRVTDATGSPRETCGAHPGGWAVASSHKIKACMTPAGEATVYGDDVPLNTGTHTFVPNLQGGTVYVGEGDAGSWEGYISGAKVCRNSGVAADCSWP